MLRFGLLSLLITSCAVSANYLFENVGIFIEPEKVSVTVLEEETVVIGIRLPKFETPNLHSSCVTERNRNLLNEIRRLEEKLVNLIPPSISEMDANLLTKRLGTQDLGVTTNRNRRFVGALAGLGGILGLGFSYYNSLRISAVGTLVDDLRNNQNKLISNFNQMRQAVVEPLLKNSIMMKHDLDTLTKKMSLMEDFACRAESSSLVQELVLRAESEYQTISQGLLEANSGILHPKLFPISKITDALRLIPSYNNSIYINQPSAIYRTSSCQFLTFFPEAGVIMYRITVPIIQEQDLGLVWRVHNVGWCKNTCQKFLTPDRIIPITHLGKQYILEVSPESCRDFNSITFCRPQLSENKKMTMCLEELLYHNKTTRCTSLIDHNLTHKVLKRVGSGLLSRGYTDVKGMFTLRGSHPMSESLKFDANKLSLIQLGRYDYVQVEDNWFKSIADPYEHPTEIYLNTINHSSEPTEDKDLLTIKKNLEHINHDPIIPVARIRSSVAHYISWTGIIFLTAVMATIVLGYYIYRRRSAPRSLLQEMNLAPLGGIREEYHNPNQGGRRMHLAVHK